VPGFLLAGAAIGGIGPRIVKHPAQPIA